MQQRVGFPPVPSAAHFCALPRALRINRDGNVSCFVRVDTDDNWVCSLHGALAA